MKALIFNSGIGKRMGSLTENKPKCLLKLKNGETILNRQIRILSYYGIKEFIITTGPFSEDVAEECLKHKDCHFSFVHNHEYATTNYIVSMYNAISLMNDDILMLHGDLVFDKKIIQKIIKSRYRSTCCVDKTKSLPKKDFKGRIINGKLHEVGINIFDDNCFALQPIYKFDKRTIKRLNKVVIKYVDQGVVSVYAENAFNDIFAMLNVRPLSYSSHFVEEIDNIEDYERVANGIIGFDVKEQVIKSECKTSDEIVNELNRFRINRPLVVCDKFAINHEFIERIKLSFSDTIVFSDFGSNPSIEMLDKGISIFAKGKCDSIVSIGGGSSIDIAKCIKIAVNEYNRKNLFNSDFTFQFTGIPHICLPSTSGTGSESTTFSVIYIDNIKYSIESPILLPEVVLLYPELVSSVPLFQKKCTMLDALCQGIESYWSKGATPISKRHSLSCLKRIVKNYKEYLDNDIEAIIQMQKAANESGKAINIAKTTAAHALSYGLTSLYGIPHGLAVALILPHVWRLLPSDYRSKCLKRVNEIMSFENVGFDGISGFMHIFDSLELEQSYTRANPKDFEYLLAHINLSRLSNFPIIELNSEKVLSIYKNLV